IQPASDWLEGRARPGTRRRARAGPRARSRCRALDSDGRRRADHGGQRVHRRRRRRRRRLGIRRTHRARGSRVDQVKVACLGMGWWSDVLADAIKRSGKLTIAACYSRSQNKREAFPKKYGCRAATSYEEILEDRGIEAIINTTPNSVHLETTEAAARAGKHVFLDKPIANTIDDARALTAAYRRAKV